MYPSPDAEKQVRLANTQAIDSQITLQLIVHNLYESSKIVRGEMTQLVSSPHSVSRASLRVIKLLAVLGIRHVGVELLLPGCAC